MTKVIAKDFRAKKEFKLPSCGVTVTAYSSLLISELNNVADIKESSKLNTAILLKMIAAWDLYASEADEKPVAITEENFGTLPASDVMWLAAEIEKFSNEQKKS